MSDSKIRYQLIQSYAVVSPVVGRPQVYKHAPRTYSDTTIAAQRAATKRAVAILQAAINRSHGEQDE